MARSAPALIVAALLLAGCGSRDQGIVGGGNVLGSTVTVYSLTRGQGTSQTARDEIDGEKLALAQAHGRAGALSVNFSSLDAGDGSDESFANAARRAISDLQTIAVVADATPVTVPLFNAAGILQVAPAGDMRLAHDPHANPSGHQTLAAPGDAPLPAGFAASFRAAFGHAPQPSAQEGYRAVQAVIRAIVRAAPAGNNRDRVAQEFIAASPPGAR
jgi:hypothetical protein